MATDTDGHFVQPPGPRIATIGVAAIVGVAAISSDSKQLGPRVAAIVEASVYKQ